MSLTPFGQDKFISVNNLQLHYVEWGGPPATRRWCCYTASRAMPILWDTFSRAMATSYHVLALDQRGHGDTSSAPEGDYAPGSFISDIVGFIDALNLGPAGLIGHSMGGRHAAMVAADYPDKAIKVVIVDTPAELLPNIMEMLNQMPQSDTPPELETFDTFEEVVLSGMAQYPLTPEAELRHANYHNLYRGADSKWRWRWDLMLLEQRRLNRSLQLDLYPSFAACAMSHVAHSGSAKPSFDPRNRPKNDSASPAWTADGHSRHGAYRECR